jgi:hypothetical protein
MDRFFGFDMLRDGPHIHAEYLLATTLEGAAGDPGRGER